ncbi:MAG: hypothetical protein MUE91_14110 [Ignavibacteriaceae bacterium]|nr:hypothetical protein [Ignavibacteriaceae bacterium]
MKNFLLSLNSKFVTCLFLSLSFIILFSGKSPAQDEAVIIDTVLQDDAVYETIQAGEFTPSKGFTLFKSGAASLNISVYGLARYINQLPGEQSFEDHLGRTRVIDTRQDIMWHRTFLWASGHFFTPKLRYCRIGVGIGPNVGTRSMMGTWPFFLSSDRVLAEEFFRPGFTSGVWIQGELLPTFYYHAMLGNNLSQLGTTASNLTRDLSTSIGFWWMPTTNEFGQRGGNGDFEMHEEVATRFGVSFTHARDDRQTSVDNPSPNNTQVKLSDGVLFYETGALAEGVTVKKADFDELAIDAGVKHNGWHAQTEYFVRNLSKFDAVGPEEELSTIPSSIFDHGFYFSLSYEAIPKLLQIYASTSWIFDDFKRNPWEIVGGFNVYPAGVRALRLNVNVIYVDKSPASSM